ncbi:MAG: branched-chain amino acid ABC transporter permease [Candidatus Caldarchaeum sp.]|nr:branched-chain amino acid ABC transporter permease [Candidatus Caldarchaeum sp.]MCS7109994.1 branched-chain amino acid ABC transporter permease [Candidatus Caldarchaeum sp.]MCX8201778.1 branched-chain amino acid ABC transporter permease [Candidatus Caldarchaeum sp.]MDW8063216.1 branched-chain amino acid ABC transporter permease [Candidatus Caldarchaeum sp.]MDW8435286.1 branched-chain amino acid ABC transporter permease [Candidatus Caldarchaeum sp.]
MITTEAFATIMVYGLITSLVYALFAEGFSLIFGVARMIDAAYGLWYAAAAYMAYALVTVYNVNVFVTFFATIAALFSAGFVYYWAVLRRIKEHIEMIMTTFLIALVIQNLIVLLFTNFPWSTPAVLPGSTVVFGVSVFNQQLSAAVAAAGLLVLLWFLIYRTKVGLAIRGVAQDLDAAVCVGIKPQQTMALVLGLSTALAGLASLLVTPQSTITPVMGWPMLTLAFAIVVLGGLGDYRGTLIAAFVIGYVEIAVQNLVSPLYAGAASLIAVLLTLWIRPRGIFGKSVEH